MTAPILTARSPLSSAFAAVNNVVSQLKAWRRGNRDFRALCAMDDRTLADLGVTRADLRDAAAHRYSDDPTVVIAERAEARRRRRAVGVNVAGVAAPVVASAPSLDGSGAEPFGQRAAVR